MKIAVDATCWQNKRGYGRHARALLRHLVKLDPSSKYVFFVDSQEDLESIPAGVEVRFVRSRAPTVNAAASNGSRSVVDMARMALSLSGAGADVLLFPTIYSYVPVLTRARKIVVIHDVIAERFPRLTLPSRRAQAFWRAKVALGLSQADAIVTVSDYSKQGIVEVFGVDPERVSVVGEASDPIFRRVDQPAWTPCLASMGLDGAGRTLIFVGGFGPHKNLELLAQVFAQLVSTPGYEDVRLVLVGEYRKDPFHQTFDQLRRQVEALHLAGKVVFTGFLPDEELVVLLNRATALVLPSLMEGFGLPAVEAAACGCPVIATTASPLPHLLGAGGVYFDPNQPEALKAALKAVLDSPEKREQMRQAGLEAANRMTWSRAAQTMQGVIQKVVAA